MWKVLGQMNMSSANSRASIDKKVAALEKKLKESDNQFIKLYGDWSKQIISEQQFRLLYQFIPPVRLGLPAGNSAPYCAKHKRTLLTEVKFTVYGDLDAQVLLRILAEVSG